MIYIYVFANEIEDIILGLAKKIIQLLFYQSNSQSLIFAFNINIIIKLVQSIILMISIYTTEKISKKF